MGEREAITDFTSLIKLNQSNNQLNRLSICTRSFEKYPDPNKIERGICDRSRDIQFVVCIDIEGERGD